MIDETPYIIVDNQKIQPISRSKGTNSATDETKQKQEQNFGVVDRVTISKEGLEKSRQKIHEADQQRLSEAQPNRLAHRSHPMLTYSPKGRP